MTGFDQSLAKKSFGVFEAFLSYFGVLAMSRADFPTGFSSRSTLSGILVELLFLITFETNKIAKTFISCTDLKELKNFKNKKVLFNEKFLACPVS